MSLADKPGGRRSPALTMTGLAGWLFADLLLVLFVTAFAFTTTPSAPPKPAPSPPVTQPPKPIHHRRQVLILRPYKFTLKVPGAGIIGSDGTSPADKTLASELHAKLEANGLGAARAGLVEAFGWSPAAGGLEGDGIAVATAANRAIKDNLSLFSTAYQQSFWTQGADGMVTLRVFFFARH